MSLIDFDLDGKLFRGTVPNLNSSEFYNWHNMDYGQGYLRGFYCGYHGHGPFGIWRGLEEEATPEMAMLLAYWLNGWSKGRSIWMEKHHEHS